VAVRACVKDPLAVKKGTPDNPLGCSHAPADGWGQGARQCYSVGLPNCRAPVALRSHKSIVLVGPNEKLAGLSRSLPVRRGSHSLPGLRS
jgi:hypothetical protein